MTLLKKSEIIPFKLDIKEIKYVENNLLHQRFKRCKESFANNGIPTTERLVFHGTNAAAEEIFEHGFLLSKVKRTGNGFGVYFS